MTRRMRAAAFLAIVATAALAAGCGGGDFPRKTRAPLPKELTGVILPSGITVSPDKASPGPVEITITNQTNEAHTVTLDGTSVRERIPPINPGDTATIQKTLSAGSYTVQAGSSAAVANAIRPGHLRISGKGRDSNDTLLTP
jgi:hypothetical protein